MITARPQPTFVVTFAVTYAIFYVVSVEYNLALFTYHPALEQFGFLVEKAKDGPAMYWYGWMATSAIAAFVLAALASWVPDGWAKRVWPGWSWVAPLSVMFVFVYILRRFFLR